MMTPAPKTTPNELTRRFAGICALVAFTFFPCLGCDKNDRSARDQASTPANATTDPKLKVVATTSIIGDWVRIVGGDNVELTTLVGPDGDPHEYEPVPSDNIAVGDSKVIVENGLGLETWMDKLYASSQSQATRIVATRGINPRNVVFDPLKHSDVDPHAWQDVADAGVMVRNIRDGMLKADPVHATAYQSRADVYLKQLAELDRWVSLQINTLPPRRRTLVTSHDAFGYFGQRYGVDVTRNALESVTSEASDPSAKQIEEIVQRIKSAAVPVIFLENIQNPKLIEQIAAEARVTVAPPLYSDALGQPGTPGDTYLKMIRYNVNTIVKALSV